MLQHLHVEWTIGKRLRWEKVGAKYAEGERKRCHGLSLCRAEIHFVL